MFDFKEKFKNRPTTELLQMLEQPEKYQPDALAAAKEIIEKRKTNDPREWENEMAVLQSAKDERKEKIVLHQSDEGNNIWVEDEKDIEDKRIARNQIFCIGLALIVVTAYSIFLNTSYLIRLSADNLPLSPYDLFSLAPNLFILISLIFFFKKEKAGWIMISAVLAFYLISKVLLFIAAIYFISFTSSTYWSSQSLITMGSQIALFGAAFYQMSTKKIMKRYHADKKTFTWITVVVAFLYICYTIGLVMRN